MNELVITHGGAGSNLNLCDGTELAAKTAYKTLITTHNIVECIVAGVKVLEDDERFNAGTGSYMKLDGEIEMDASIMLSDLSCGAVAGIKYVKNPIEVARKVMETPHILLVGDNATKFAHKYFRYYNPITEKAKKRYDEVKKWLETKNFPEYVHEKWKTYELETVGIVVKYKNMFGAGVSTGGVSLALPGRVGDSAIIGAGIYAGEKGAVCCTGIGEEIIRYAIAKTVYDRLDKETAQDACEFGVKLCGKYHIGIIATAKDSYGMACNKDMACTVYSKNYIKNGI